MKKRTSMEIGALALLVLIAGIVFYFEGSPAGQSAHANTLATVYKPMGVENPQIHWDRLAETQATEYKTTGRDIFNWQLPAPPPPPPAPAPEPVVEIAPPPPPPPPPPKLPLKYFGYGPATASSGRRAFLTDGDDVYIVAEGDTVLGHFRIIKISSVTVEFEDATDGRRGSARLEDQGPAT